MKGKSLPGRERAQRRASRARRSVSDRIIAGLSEARDALREGAELSSRFTVRTVEIPEPEAFTPARIRALRDRLELSQGVFAALIGVSKVLVQSWEQGTREPSPLARRLLSEIEREPRRWQRMIVSSSASGTRRRSA